ncbi:hypothetical protein E2C01_025710 [Portunus trituberculatus]|uniref:Uncharacterized protein n=1 Tax=Portunus trituberculatus TaxID=210409 RepID=A0A5B7EDN3_PORTR|nr:hypothetical protein [Portunus trituberculatus]
MAPVFIELTTAHQHTRPLVTTPRTSNCTDPHLTTAPLHHLRPPPVLHASTASIHHSPHHTALYPRPTPFFASATRCLHLLPPLHHLSSLQGEDMRKMVCIGSVC